MTLKIEFNTDGDQPEREAGALMALLVTLYPNAGDAALAGLTQTTGDSLPQWYSADGKPVGDFDPDGHPGRAPYDPTPDIGPESTLESPIPAFIQEAIAAGEAAAPLTAEQAFGAPASPQPQAAAASATVAAAPSVAQAAPAAPATAAGEVTAAGSLEAGSVERDAEGLPWHEEIHSSNRKKSANGKWMKRRGVNQLVENRIRAELLAANSARTLAEVTGSGLVPPPPGAAPAPPVPVAPSASVHVPTAPTAAPPPSTAGTPTPEKIKRFGEMMTRINAAEKAGTLAPGVAVETARRLELTALVDLMKCDDATYAAFVSLIEEAGA